MTTIIPGLYGLDSASAFRALQKDPQKYIDRFSKDKTVQKEIEYFTKKAPSFNSIDDLMKDRRALQFVLDSYGMGSEIDNAGRIRKILTEDPTNSNALVNKLVDPRFKNLATSLRLDQGMDKLQSLVSTGAMKTNYIQNEFEEALGQQDNALRQAAYFARNTGTIQNVYSILGDKVLRDVVTSTFNLPKELAVQSVESQARVVAARVDITKFNTSGTSSVSASQLTRAKADHDLIGKNLAISDAANKQVKTIQDTLAQLATDYANLAVKTDPAGANAATIAIQQNAIPELVRYEQLLNAGDKAMGSVQSGLASLQTLIAEAQKPGANLASLKTQFSNAISNLNNQIQSASIIAPDGSSQNILQNGSADVLTTVYDDQNSSISINRYDLSGLQDLLNDAESAFNAVTDSGDTANLTNSLSRILRAGDAASDVTTQLAADKAALNTTATTGFFAASLNTSELMHGQQSINDGLSRISQIETVLKNIGDLAKQSKALAPEADRTALETQFDALKTQLQGLIENTGEAGLDNFLNNIPDQQYEIVNGQTVFVKGGFDLKASIYDVINSHGLGNATDADALEIATIQVTTSSDRAKASLNAYKPNIDSVISHYDPRGSLDSLLHELQNNVDFIINGAAVGEQNLLSPDQQKIQLDISTGTGVVFNNLPNFKQDLTNAFDSIVAQLGNGPNAIIGALDDALFNIGRAKRTLESDNRFATIEYGRLAGTIDALDPKNTESDSKLYQTNAFTAKFISRYLVMNGSDGSTASSGSGNYLMALFGGSTDTNAAMGNIMSLAVSLRA